MTLLFSNNLCAAFLAEIVRSFQRHHRKHYLGRTAMQKLAYFAQATGVPVPCSFEIYNFGPYSDTVTFTVESMIADDILEDTSGKSKYSNYKLKTNAPQFSEEIEKSVLPHSEQIDSVVQVLGKFNPAELELLATLHFIAAKITSLGGTATKDSVLNQFFQIKGLKFSEKEISSWYDDLKSARLV